MECLRAIFQSKRINIVKVRSRPSPAEILILPLETKPEYHYQQPASQERNSQTDNDTEFRVNYHQMSALTF